MIDEDESFELLENLIRLFVVSFHTRETSHSVMSAFHSPSLLLWNSYIDIHKSLTTYKVLHESLSL